MFVVIGICFLLPFVSVTCSGVKLFTLSGLDLVTGTTVELNVGDLGGLGGLDPSLQPPATEEETDPELFAILALAAAGLGLVLSFIPRAPGAIAASIVSLVGAAFLIALQVKISGDIEDEAGGAAGGVVSASYELGYWLTLVLFVLAAALFAYLARAATRQAATGPP